MASGLVILRSGRFAALGTEGAATSTPRDESAGSTTEPPLLQGDPMIVFEYRVSAASCVLYILPKETTPLDIPALHFIEQISIGSRLHELLD